ncbi:MAG: stage III sporulation protein AA [Clostridiales bacterium]|nr:stage III sporulation protein AA [Clostridiales bacterium]
MALKDDVLKIFSPDLRRLLGKIPLEFDKLLEIRLRVNGPLIVIEDNEEYMIDSDGGICTCIDKAYIVTARDIRETMALVSDYSVYAYEDDIRQGFITIKGGHRVGIAGKIVLEGAVIRTIQYISFMNIRLAHQIKGCADKVMPYIFEKGRICHTLIVSPPCCGKTTLLRDMIRQVSEREKGMSIGVVDERSEIAACYLGVPQNDLGIRADVLDGCPKAKGMLMLLRSMSPQLIAVDEIGSREDMEAIEYVIHCGCKLLATVHGNSVDDLMQKPVLGKLVKARIFERYIVLSNREEIGHIEAVYNAFGSNLFFN